MRKLIPLPKHTILLCQVTAEDINSHIKTKDHIIWPQEAMMCNTAKDDVIQFKICT